jgi:serine/threonine protein kinase
MDLTVENVSGLLIRSRLLTPEDVKTAYQRWLGEAKGAAQQLGPYLKWLVMRGYLTEYQANLIARGHADNFFIEQYKILDRIGKGRMAGVYKAVHQLGQTVAIKVLPPSKAKDAQTLGRFQREARLALRLKHPNIVRTFQMGESNGLHFIVMEYLEGETLDDMLLRRGKLPPPEAVRLVHQALMGLQHIHEQGLIHRDLKPANLMLVPARQPNQPDTTTTATLKVLDIGLGRALFDESVTDGAANANLTTEGAVLGTPEYMAPEQARNAHGADIRADIYSLGCVLYHFLSGQPPFPDKNLVNQMVRHLTEKAKPLKAFNPAVPDGLQQIVDWMMAKDPAQRYPTPERAAQALQVFLSAAQERLQTPESDPSMSTYLEWLQGQQGGQAAPAPAPVPSIPQPVVVARPPVAVAPPPVPVAQPPVVVARPVAAAPRPVVTAPVSIPAPAVARPVVAEPQRKRRTTASPTPVAAPPTPVVPERSYDVELIEPIGAPQKPTDGDEIMGLRRRDFIMLGSGAVGVLAAVVAGYALSQLLRNKDIDKILGDEAPAPSPTPPAPPKDE